MLKPFRGQKSAAAVGRQQRGTASRACWGVPFSRGAELLTAWARGWCAGAWPALERSAEIVTCCVSKERWLPLQTGHLGMLRSAWNCTSLLNQQSRKAKYGDDRPAPRGPKPRLLSRPPLALVELTDHWPRAGGFWFWGCFPFCIEGELYRE
ncbi:hypothetical protein Q31a_53840 [Aureliella helgolandensis]|uniref:Uncharacterized protein n=1 Tax=Aureliella helgolandensis TaxID=2527968 RepID=A0A518GEI5_9BACT|nr:hypothetical protein Q31a_53840 [Aureliella helgolandensis]